MLDKTTYNLLLKIKNEEKCKSDGSSDFLYLKEFQFIDYYSNYFERFHITAKGNVALRNYEENEKLIFFNKCISIATIFIAMATLIVTIITLCITLK